LWGYGVAVAAYSGDPHATTVVLTSMSTYYIGTAIASFVDVALPVYQIVVADVAPTPNHGMVVIDSPNLLWRVGMIIRANSVVDDDLVHGMIFRRPGPVALIGSPARARYDGRLRHTLS